MAVAVDLDSEVAERDLAVLRAKSSPPACADLDPRAFQFAVADALVAYWDAVLAPLWDRARLATEADITHHAQAVGREGLAAAMNDLHERVSFEDSVIRVECEPKVAVEADGRVWLVPSVFRWPGFAVQYETARPVICYAARGAGRVWSGGAKPSDAATDLLGSGRARVLAAVGLPTSTTEVAEALELAKGTVSEHLTTLAAARRVRDETLPVGQRFRSLGSCLQWEQPIGFAASVYYLEGRLGLPSRSPDFLVPALDLLKQERASRLEVERRYAALRMCQKRHGSRTPHPDTIRPRVPVRWHGDEREAALYVLRQQVRVRRWEGLVDQPEAARAIRIARVLASGPRFTAFADRDALQESLDWARAGVRADQSGSGHRGAGEIAALLAQIHLRLDGAPAVGRAWNFTAEASRYMPRQGRSDRPPRR